MAYPKLRSPLQSNVIPVRGKPLPATQQQLAASSNLVHQPGIVSPRDRAIRMGGMQDDSYIWKPGTGKGPVFLAPDVEDRGGAPTITLADGTKYTGRYYNTNEGRHQYVFDDDVLGQEGATLSYNDFSQEIGNTNQSYEGHGGDPWDPREKGSVGSGGGSSASGGAGNTSTTVTTGGNNQFVLPDKYDFEGIEFHPADWEKAMADARAAGDKAKEQYLQNLKDAQQPALDLVNTDIKGIQAGLDALVPRARAEGDADTQTNMTRAGQIDAFDQSRLPGINKFNRGEVSETNDFNRGEFEEAVGASGIDYKRRVTEVLDELGTEMTGSFGDKFLDNLTSTIARDRGAEISSAAGVGTRSGAGIGVQDRLDANQRIAMAQRAQGMIPGIAGQAQQILQPPLEVAKTQQQTPTAVPLNTSNIGDRVPIQANISAGNTAYGIANNAQSYQAIGAPQALSSNLQNQQYNSSMQLSRDEFVANAVQDQYNADANATQGGINSDKADQIRAEGYAAYQEGVQTRSQNEGIAAGANLLGAGASALGSSGVLSGGSNNGTNNTGTTANGTAAGGHSAGSAGTVGAANSSIDNPSAGGAGWNSSSAPSGTDDIFTNPSSGGDVSSVPTASGETSSTIDPVTSSSSGTVTDSGGFGVDDGGDYGSFGGPSDSGSFFGKPAEPMQLAGPTGLSGSAPSGYGGGNASTVYTPPSFNVAGGYSAPSGNSADIGATQFSGGRPVGVGNINISENDYRATIGASDRLFGPKGSFTGGKPTEAFGSSQQGAAQVAANSFLPQQGNDSQGRPGPVENAPAGPFRTAAGAIKNPGLDAQSVQQGIEILTGWERMTPGKKLLASGQQGVSVLEGKGMMSPGESRAVGTAVGALATMSDPTASATDKAAASGMIGINLANRSFTGTVDRPTSIGGKAVVGQGATANGAPAHKLSDGSVVSHASLQSTADTQGALSAYQILMSNAPEDKKSAALAATGVKPAAAQALIKQVADGDSVAALSLFNTGTDWEDQNEVQKAALVMQTSSTVHSTLARSLPSVSQNKTGTGANVFKGPQGKPLVSSGGFTADASGAHYGNLNADASGVHYDTSVAGNDVRINPMAGTVSTDFYGFEVPILSINPGKPGTPGTTPTVATNTGGTGASIGPSGANVHTTGSINEDNHVSASVNVAPSGSASVTPTVQIGNSPGARQGSGYGGQAGAFIGSVFGPYGTMVGSAIGSAIGSVLGDKYIQPKGQDIRNGWRSGLDKGGVTEKDGGKRNITLADGSKYDIGIDGGSTLKNSDGTDRFSYEVDWTNPVAADSIPAAHIVAIATGMTPSDDKKDSFNRIAGQLTNGITSNAKNVGDAYKNAKAITDKAQVSPQNIGMKIEGMRLTNQISEQEYGVYLDTMNKMYGTSFKPIDRAKSQDNFERLFGSQENLDKNDKKFLESLKDEKLKATNLSKTEKRIGEQKKTDTGGLVAPDRYAGRQTVSNTANIQQAI